MIQLDSGTNTLKWKCTGCNTKVRKQLGNLDECLDFIHSTRGYRPCDKCAGTEKTPEEHQMTLFK